MKDTASIASTKNRVLNHYFTLHLAGRTRYIRSKHICMLLCMGVVVHAALLTFFDLTSWTAQKMLTTSANKSNSIDAAVTIATGKYSATRLISTLRMHGGYTGPIYVITDHPEEVRKHGALPLELRDHLGPTFQSDVARQRWEDSKIVKVKWYKTQLFHMLPNDIQTVLFLDADVEINAPMTSFQNAIADYKEHLAVTKCTAYFFAERFYTPDNHNSGTGVLFREASAELLQEWGDEILTGKHIRDQVALDTTLKRTGLKVCDLPARMNYYSTDLMTQVTNILLGGRVQKHATFIHETARKNLRDLDSSVDH